MALPTPLPWPETLEREARARLAALPLPEGGLGKLAPLAAWWAAARGACPPPVPVRPRLCVFAADHGVLRQSVSVSPAGDTERVARGLLAGRGVVPATARAQGIEVELWDVGVDGALPAPDAPAATLRSSRVRAGTRDFTEAPALTPEEALAAIGAGVEAARRAAAEGVTLLGAAELGAGGSTSAAAILAACTGMPAKLTAGRGSGVDEQGLARKIAVIDAALALHRPDRFDAMGILCAVGGLEIAAVAGLCLGGASLGVPVVLDGFVSTAGGLVAHTLDSSVTPWLLVSQKSAENAHWAMSRYLGREPLQDLELRMGGGLGALLAMDLVRVSAGLLA